MAQALAEGNVGIEGDLLFTGQRLECCDMILQAEIGLPGRNGGIARIAGPRADIAWKDSLQLGKIKTRLSWSRNLTQASFSRLE